MRTSYAVGVDVGGTRIAVGLVERKGRVVKDAKRLTPKTGPFAVVDTIIDLVEEVSAGAHQSEIAGIGIGIPAQIDFLRQSVEFCTNLPLAGVDVRSLVMSRSKLEVTIDNDGNMAALGESRYGAAKGARDFLMITVGTGVGGGIFLDGEPYRGSRGLGGEIGHMVVELDGASVPVRRHRSPRGVSSAVRRSPREAARPRRSYSGREILAAAGGELDGVTAESVLIAAQAGDDGRARDPARVRRHARPRARRLRQHLQPQAHRASAAASARRPTSWSSAPPRSCTARRSPAVATSRSSRRCSATTPGSSARRRSRSTNTMRTRGMH